MHRIKRYDQHHFRLQAHVQLDCAVRKVCLLVMGQLPSVLPTIRRAPGVAVAVRATTDAMAGSLQVSSANWCPQLVQEWKKVVAECDFVAIDTELTGLAEKFKSNKGALNASNSALPHFTTPIPLALQEIPSPLASARTAEQHKISL